MTVHRDTKVIDAAVRRCSIKYVFLAASILQLYLKKSSTQVLFFYELWKILRNFIKEFYKNFIKQLWSTASRDRNNPAKKTCSNVNRFSLNDNQPLTYLQLLWFKITKSVQSAITEVYLEACYTSLMERFYKNRGRLSVVTLPAIAFSKLTLETSEGVKYV